MIIDNNAYRLAIAVGVGGTFLLVWLGLGVGIIGADGDRANILYSGVLATGLVGAVISRFQPRGMARTMFAMAIVQALVGLVALVAGLGRPSSGPLEILGLTGFFVALFAGSGWLFLQAAHGRAERRAV
ncbi:MAG TPA: hypothetical protein VHL54_03410 [Actinomycetota bacterium]|nr:hypothetical protein [Actinomycetota bacterium]